MLKNIHIMSILNSVIKIFVGDKQQKDLKCYNQL